MSSVRTHFCTLVARGKGGVDWPRKNGLNGTIPATVNSRVGSSLISEADGTTVWPARSKCPRKRRRISWVCITHLYLRIESCFCDKHRSGQRAGAGGRKRPSGGWG